MKRRSISFAIALALVCGLTIGANAAGTLKEISAYLNYGITVKYNGETQALKDASGSTVYPITYNGTTYLPVRAVSNMLGIAVDWDQATQTVLLGESAGGTNLLENFVPYTKYQADLYPDMNYGPVFFQNADKSRSIGGETVSSWLCLWNIDTYRATYPDDLIASFNLGGKYTTLTFKAYSDEDTTLTVMGDNGSVLGDFSLKGGQIPQTFTIDLHSTTQLTFQRGATPLSKYGWPELEINTYVFNATLQ